MSCSRTMTTLAPTFFEGPEKKFELVLKEGSSPLRNLGHETWHRIVEAADAQVLSVLEGEFATAYLLSESSLFVYDEFLTMITCGRTRLINALVQVVELVGQENVALAMYERKNEHFPDRQHSSFYDDARRLKAELGGSAIRFGDEHDHHVHLFSTNAPFTPHPTDTTLEILMHGLDPQSLSRFVGAKTSDTTTLAETYGLTELLPGFAIDEHAFTPAGYSMNGLRGENYYTIHVTPESLGSYVSFETNLDFRGRLEPLVSGIVDVFRPRSFDVMTFEPNAQAAASKVNEEIIGDDYLIKDRFSTTQSGYDIRFWHAFAPRELQAPFRLEL